MTEAATDLERPRDVIERTTARIATMLEHGELTLPAGYAWQNALKGAWLWLQDATIQSGELKGKPILKVVTPTSVANALLKMVVQGLAVHRQQGYLIPYGTTLTFQRSVFGTVTVARREAGLVDATAELILKGDAFEYEIEAGRKRVTTHRQTFEALEAGEIAGAYAHLTFTDATRNRDEIMTWAEIQASWKQSKQAGYDSSPHRRFAGEMAKRTVLARALKLLVNAATDEPELLRAWNDDDLGSDEDDIPTIDADAPATTEGEPPVTLDAEPETPYVEEPMPEPEPARSARRAKPKPPEAAPLEFPEDPGF